MKFILIAISLLSLNAFAADVDLDCKGATISESGPASEAGIFNQRITVPEDVAVLILVEKDNLRVVKLEELTEADDQKHLIMLSQNREEASDTTYLFVLKARIDLNGPEAILVDDVTQLGDINNTDFVVMNRPGAYVLQCKNAE